VSEDIEVRDGMIRLGALLKVAGMIDAGGEARAFLAENAVLVNGEPEQRRGRQLHPGDEVAIGDTLLRLVDH
jgi:ribosome-associated protein